MKIVALLIALPFLACGVADATSDSHVNLIASDYIDVAPDTGLGAPPDREHVPKDVRNSGQQSSPDVIRQTSADDLSSEKVPVELLLRGARISEGEMVNIGINNGHISHVVPASVESLSGSEEVNLSGKWVLPSFIDSHVHLSYLPAENAMLDGGIAGVVDLAAPIQSLGTEHAITMVASGPMITAVGGYPTQSWGANGYGLECSGEESVEASVQLLAGLGAKVIKVPLGHGPSLSDASMKKAVTTAHTLNLPVAVHALDDHQVIQASSAGADVLAHTPVGTLSDAAVASWGQKAVITTLGAFGGGAAALENLQRFVAEGATILYGTDFGNTSIPGIHPNEIALMISAGMSGKDIVASATHVPADFWGLSHLGSLTEGKEASLLVLTENPYATPMTLASPEAVLFKGKWR